MDNATFITNAFCLIKNLLIFILCLLEQQLTHFAFARSQFKNFMFRCSTIYMLPYEYKSAYILWHFNCLCIIRLDKSKSHLYQVLIEIERNKFLFLMLEQCFREDKHVRVLHDKQLCQLKIHVASREEVH